MEDTAMLEKKYSKHLEEHLRAIGEPQEARA